MGGEGTGVPGRGTRPTSVGIVILTKTQEPYTAPLSIIYAFHVMEAGNSTICRFFLFFFEESSGVEGVGGGARSGASSSRAHGLVRPSFISMQNGGRNTS